MQNHSKHLILQSGKSPNETLIPHHRTGNHAADMENRTTMLKTAVLQRQPVMLVEM